MGSGLRGDAHKHVSAFERILSLPRMLRNTDLHTALDRDVTANGANERRLERLARKGRL